MNIQTLREIGGRIVRFLRAHRRASVLVAATIGVVVYAAFAARFGSQNASIIPALPPFQHATFPVSSIPNWGTMHSAAEWDRTYAQMDKNSFVPVPTYDLSVLTIPLKRLTGSQKPSDIAAMTAKLFYSTRFFGAYDLDSNEFQGRHAGIDLKLPLGTPVGAIAGGRVRNVGNDPEGLGHFVMIDHLAPDGRTYISIYGHLDKTSVTEGQTIVPGQVVGTIGLTGNTTVAHLHLQIDLDDGFPDHLAFAPSGIPTKEEAARFVISPIDFIQRFSSQHITTQKSVSSTKPKTVATKKSAIIR